VRVSASSTLGRLHADLEGVQPKPATPTDPADLNKDSAYDAAMTHASVLTNDYLAALGPATADSSAAASNTATASFHVFLLEQSRLKHQGRAWGEMAVTLLDASQQDALENLVRELGCSVQAGSLERVLAFQQQLTEAPALLRRCVLSNNAIVDAWTDFLFGAKAYGALRTLLRQRLAAGVDTFAYALSRNALAKMMAACAIEGDSVGSLMLLRESSWGALAKLSAAQATAATTAHTSAAGAEPTDLIAAATVGMPACVNSLPSWVPRYWSTAQAWQSLSAEGAQQQPRTPSDEAALSELCDSLLSAAGQGFGATAVQQPPSPVAASAPTVSAPILAPKPLHPRLSISLPQSRANPPPSAFRSSLHRSSSSLLSHAAAGGSTPTGAGMSTRARSYAAPPTEQTMEATEAVLLMPPQESAVPARPATPPTPLPVLDLATELHVDSRLMELAVVAAARAQYRSSEFARRDADAAVRAYAAANPASEDAEVNLAVLTEARSLAQTHAEQYQRQRQQQNARRSTRALDRVTRTSSQLAIEENIEPDDVEDFGLEDEDESGGMEDSSDGAAAPTSLFSLLNDPVHPPPLAFQLWSLMLQQQIPLQHSASFVQLLSSLQAHTQQTAADATSSSAAASLLLSTLSSEMSHSRSDGGVLQHKWLRADEAAFRQGELELLVRLSTRAAAEDEPGDAAWQAVDLLRQMHAEGVSFANPSAAAVTVSQLYRAVLEGAAPGFARTKLLQDLLLAVEDLASVGSAATLSVEQLLEQVAVQEQ
jgi:hypothetical protein